MPWKPVAGSLFLLGAWWPVLLGQATFQYSFSGPDLVPCRPEAVSEFLVGAQVRASAGGGADALSMGVLAQGCKIAVLDVDTATLKEAELSFLHSEKTAEGAVLAAVAREGAPRLFLESGGPHRVMTLQLEGGQDCESCTLRFVDGIQSAGQPVRNLVTYQSQTAVPELAGKTVTFPRPAPDPRPVFDYVLTGPALVTGTAGRHVDFALDGFLKTAGLDGVPDGAQAFSMGMAAAGATVTGLDLNHLILREEEVDFLHVETADDRAVVSAVLGVEMDRTLDPAESPHRLFTLRLRGQVPAAGCTTARVRFVDGLPSQGTPVRNVVTYRQRSYVPSLGSAMIQLCAPELQARPSFRYFLDGPQVLKGTPGGTMDFSLRAFLATAGLPAGAPGAEAWSMAIHSTEAEILAATTEGTASHEAEFLAVDSTEHGATLAAVLGMKTARSLEPERSPQHVLTLRLQGTFPAAGSCSSLRFAFQDGIQTAGQPVRNAVTFRATSFYPTLGSFTVQLCDRSCGEAAVQVIESETAAEAVLTAAQPTACFRYQTRPGAPVVFTLEDAEEQDWNVLYVRWGSPPTRTEFDLVARDVLRSSQRLFIQSAASADCYALVEARHLAGAGNRVELTALQPAVSLDDLCVRRAIAGEEFRSTITGSGLYPDFLVFSLIPAAGGRPIVATGYEAFSANTVEVGFAIPAGAVGLYHLEVGDLGSPSDPYARLDNAVQVSTAPLEALEFELSGLDELRLHTPSRVALRFRNNGAAGLLAPLCEVVGPEGMSFRLPGQPGFNESPVLPGATGRRVQVLCLGPEAGGNLLAPGAGGELSLAVLNERHGIPLAGLDVYLFTPTDGDEIDWGRQPPPLGVEDWPALWPLLEQRLGTTWREYHQSLVEIGLRLRSRGRSGASVIEAFQFAAAEVLGRPTGAISGRLLSQAAGEPLAGVLLLAVDPVRREARACARSGARGDFTVEGLANSTAYQLEAESLELAEAILRMPAAGDLLAVVIHAQPRQGAAPALPACPPGPSGLPLEPLLLAQGACADRYLLPVEKKDVHLLQVWDPNDKRGPPGRGGRRRGRLINPGAQSTLHYTIHFENVGLTANTLVQRVTITDDELDESLDWSTLCFGEVKIEDQLVQLSTGEEDCAATLQENSNPTAIPFSNRCDCLEAGCASAPPHSSSFAPPLPETGSGTCSSGATSACARVPVRYLWDTNRDGAKEERNAYVDIHARLETNTGGAPVQIEWILEAKSYPDPSVPLGTSDGFLPPSANDDCGRGAGYVSFSVKVKDSVKTGGEGKKVRNAARIQFDNNKPIATEAWENTVCLSGPAALPRAVFPADRAREVGSNPLFLWESDCRAETYGFYLWESDLDRPSEPTGAGLADSSYRLAGSLPPETTFLWQVVAWPSEPEYARTEGPEWSFTTASPVPGCPQAPAELSPDGGGCFSASGRLAWAAAAGATRYEVVVAPLDAHVDGVIIKVTDSTVDVCRLGLEPGDYLWQVIAMNDACPTPEQGSPSGFASLTLCEDTASRFRRGDSNGDGTVNITDPIYTLNALFAGGESLDCLDAADADDSGTANITDPINTLNFLFQGGNPLPEPAACGYDCTADGLAPCQWRSSAVGCSRGA